MPGYTKILPPSIVVAGRHGCPFLWRSGQPTRAYNIAALGRVLAPWRPASPRSVPTDRRSSPKRGLICWSLWILMDPYGLTGLSDLNFLCTNCGSLIVGWQLKVLSIGFFFGTFKVRPRKSPFFPPVLTPYNGRRSDRLPMTQLKASSSRPWASRLKTKPCWFLWGQQGG